MLAEALFERIDGLGFREATRHLRESAIAHCFAAVMPERMEMTVGNGRGERDRPSDNYIVVDFIRRTVAEQVETP